MSELSTGTKGAISELRVASHLMGLGFQVFKNLSMHGSCDLVAISRRGRVIKVQVKSTLSINSFRNLRLGQNQLLACLVNGEIHYRARSEEHTSELQSRFDLVCRLLLEKKKKIMI